MGKYIPPEKMSEAQIRAELDDQFKRWNHIASHGCADPFWPDGLNMNLVRNHIIYWYQFLAEKIATPVQLSLFDIGPDLSNERPIPPEVSDRYMVLDGDYPDRLNNRGWPDLVWGRKGEYYA